MKMRITVLLVTLGGFFLFNSCDKTPGYGGNCGITGVLKIRKFNTNFSKFKQEIIAPNTDVYIVFQDGQGYGDKTKTSFDGSFSFNHLVKGDYKIFAYSADSTLVFSTPITVTADAKITKSKQLVNVGVIKIADNTPIAGSAFIKGKVITHKANVAYTSVIQKVYMFDVDDSTKISNTNTDYNGNYSFNNLNIGKYKVYVYSKNTIVSPPTVILDTTVSIFNSNDVILLNDFNINN